jgi:hypothetical protein
MVTKLHGYKVTWLQGYKVTGLQGYRVTGLQGYMVISYIVALEQVTLPSMKLRKLRPDFKLN